VIRGAAIFGSPRRDGHSTRLHEAFIGGLNGVTVDRIRVYDLDILPCTACGFCREEFGCIHDDDMTRLYGTIAESAIVSVSMPLYFSSPPSPLKAFIDRCQVFWEAGKRKGVSAVMPKLGFFIAVGGGRYRGMFEPSVTIMRHFFRTLGCSVEESDYILVDGVDGEKDDLPEAYLARAREGGRRCARLLTGLTDDNIPRP